MNPEEFEEFKATFGVDFATHEGDSVKGMSTGKYLPVINEWRKWPYGRQYNFYASDAEKCPRRLFYTMWNIPQSNPEITDQANNNFDIGHMAEEHIVRKYRQLRGVMWEQSRCMYNLLGDAEFREEIEGLNAGDNNYGVNILDMFMPRITGNMDIVFDDLSKVFDHDNSEELSGCDNSNELSNKKAKRYIIEVKTIKDWPFASHSKQGEKEPFMIGADMVTPEGYYLQLCSYLYINQVENGMLHFFNKNNGAERIWEATLEKATHAMETAVLPKFKALYIAYLKRELPERICKVKLSKDNSRILKTGSTWKALYCPYSSQCWLLDGIECQPKFGEFKDKPSKPKEVTKDEPSRKSVARRTRRRRRVHKN